MSITEKPVGQTQDAGWQLGLQKTFPFSQKYLWDFMFSDEGLKTWLGTLENELTIKESYSTKEGVEGLVRIFKPYSHIRMTWKKSNRKNFSVVQVRVIGDQQKTVISFHQEKLSDNNQREEMKAYWNDKMLKIEQKLNLQR